jgi:hypothetical protein
MAQKTSIPKSVLIDEITTAFDGVTRDDGVTLHQAIALDHYGGHDPEKMAEARAKDLETRWQDIPHVVIGNASENGVRQGNAGKCRANFVLSSGVGAVFPTRLFSVFRPEEWE